MSIDASTSRDAGGPTLPRTARRAQLGWSLQFARAMIWEMVASGDDYSYLILDAHDDAQTAFNRLTASRTCVRSMTNSIIVTDEALARRVLMSSSWGVAGKEGAQATQQVMVLPGAGLDALDSVERDSGIGSPDTRRFDHGPCEELKSSIDGIVDAAVGDTVHFGQVDIQAICRSAAASVAAAV